jgi:hypothetical protein
MTLNIAGKVKKTVKGFASAARPIGIDGESWTTGR